VLSVTTIAALFPDNWDVTVIDENSAPVDLYFQMIGYDSSNPNFCIPDKVLNLMVKDGSNNEYWNGSICPLYPGQSSNTPDLDGYPDYVFPRSEIAPLGNNVGPGQTKSYIATVTLDEFAGNHLMGGSNKDIVHIIAVQAGGPAPVPDRQGFPYTETWDAWPVDTHGKDDDPNYP